MSDSQRVGQYHAAIEPQRPERQDQNLCCRATGLALAAIAVFVGAYLFICKPLILVVCIAASYLIYSVASRCFPGQQETQHLVLPPSLRRPPDASRSSDSVGAGPVLSGLPKASDIDDLLIAAGFPKMESLPRHDQVVEDYQTFSADQIKTVTLAADGKGRRYVLIPIQNSETGEKVLQILRELEQWRICSNDPACKGMNPREQHAIMIRRDLGAVQNLLQGEAVGSWRLNIAEPAT